MNVFEIFELEPCPWVDEELLKARFKELAARCHPDCGGAKEDFEILNKAYGVLSSPAQTLRHYLEVKGLEYDPRGVVGNELMDLFVMVGGLLQEADGFIRKQETASSALAKALLEPQSMALQEQLSQLIDAVVQAEQQQRAALANGDLAQIARNLAFLEKWRSQLRQRFAGLF